MPTTTPPFTPEADTASDADSSPEHAQVTTETALDESRFRSLLRRWNRHQDLRRDGADVAALSRSSEVLDAARQALRSAPYGRGA